MYCTYLTIYRGHKMPPFYIGRSTTEKIARGYRGSVSSKQFKEIWKSELRDNPDLFDTRVLTTHDDLQTCAEREESFHVSLNVHRNPLYVNMATGRGKFHTSHRGKENFWYGKDRSSVNNPMFGRKHTEKTRALIGERMKGKTKGIRKSASHVESVRVALTGRSYDELHGASRAIEIREKLKGPKSETHKANLKAACKIAASTPRTCPYCSKDIYGASNYSRWHGVNCKFSRNIDESIQGVPVPA